MTRALTGTALAVALLLTAADGWATPVYWIPAHDLVPELLGGYLTWGDLDADGDDDVLEYAATVHWNTGCPESTTWESEGGFYCPVAGCSTLSSTLGDVDADGDLDLIYACWQCCSFRMVWNTGTPQDPLFEYGGAIAGDPLSPSNSRAWLADIDADGDLDLLNNPSNSRVQLYENTGTPSSPFWVRRDYVPGVLLNDGHGQLGLGDLDGDGDLDIVSGVPTVLPSVQCWENVGTPQSPVFVENPAMLTGVDTSAPWLTMGLALPDVDCDGDPDLIISAHPSFYLYLNEQVTPARPASWGAIKALYRP